MPQRSPLMNMMVKAAEKAARGLVRDFGEVEQLQVSRKGPADFVTAADKRSEKIIFETLSEAYPDRAFLMEESGSQGPDGAKGRFIIDPLDGTQNFTRGIPHWNISIGYEEGGKIIAGLVYDPVKNEMFTAEKGAGAFVNNKRLMASGRNQMEGASIAVGRPPLEEKARARFFAELDKVTALSADCRRFAAAALDLCYVAAGRLDAYWERGVKPWDVAAGVLIVTEAKGRVSSLGRDADPVHSGAILATNQAFHDDFRQLLK